MLYSRITASSVYDAASESVRPANQVASYLKTNDNEKINKNLPESSEETSVLGGESWRKRWLRAGSIGDIGGVENIPESFDEHLKMMGKEEYCPTFLAGCTFQPYFSSASSSWQAFCFRHCCRPRNHY